jgi:hypothetical protein
MITLIATPVNLNSLINEFLINLIIFPLNNGLSFTKNTKVGGLVLL